MKPAYFFATILDKPGNLPRNDKLPSSSSTTFSICFGDDLGGTDAFLAGDTLNRCIEISPSESIRECSSFFASGDDLAGFAR